MVKLAAWPANLWPPGTDLLSLQGPESTYPVVIIIILPSVDIVIHSRGSLKIKIIQNWYSLSVHAVSG